MDKNPAAVIDTLIALDTIASALMPAVAMHGPGLTAELRIELEFQLRIPLPANFASVREKLAEWREALCEDPMVAIDIRAPRLSS